MNRRKSNRAIEKEALTEMIEDIFQKDEGRYGARRIQLILERQGVKINQKRVSKLISARGLIAKGTRKAYRKIKKGTSCILNYTTTQSEFIPLLAGLVQCNLKTKMLKKPYLFLQFFLTAPRSLFCAVRTIWGSPVGIQRRSVF